MKRPHQQDNDPPQPATKKQKEESSSEDESTMAASPAAAKSSPGPFDGMHIASHECLKNLGKRTKCPKCGHMKKYFCYECMVNFCPEVPQLHLPILVDIIHYPSELLSKSTAVHASLIAPEQARLIDFPDVPDYPPEDFLQTAKSLFEYEPEFLSKVKRLVVVDSQWHKARAVLRHQNLAKLKCVKIFTRKTAFWRYQHCGDEFLATIEAIYHFLTEYHEATNGRGTYDGSYNMIQGVYKAEGRNFVHKENYIRYNSGEEQPKPPPV